LKCVKKSDISFSSHVTPVQMVVLLACPEFY